MVQSQLVEMCPSSTSNAIRLWEGAYPVHCHFNWSIVILWKSNRECEVGVRAIHMFQVCAGHFGWASHSEHVGGQSGHWLSKGKGQVQYVSIKQGACLLAVSNAGGIQQT